MMLMLRKITAGVLTYRAVLLVMHGFGWMFYGRSFGGDSSAFSILTTGVSVLSITAAMVLLTFAYLATRRDKAEWSAKNAVLDGDVENTGAGLEASHGFDSDAVIERYLAEKSIQQNSQPSVPVKPIAAVSVRPVFGRKAI
jgi:hypothetical protein